MSERSELGREAAWIFTDPNAYADSAGWHKVATRLRYEDPVPFVEADGFVPFFVVTRHADVAEIERQHETFWNTQDAVLGQTAVTERLRNSGVDIKTLIHMDGAEHRAHRRITNDWFKPAASARRSKLQSCGSRRNTSTACATSAASATSPRTSRSTIRCRSS
jgi:cytochrome P450